MMNVWKDKPKLQKEKKDFMYVYACMYAYHFADRDNIS